MTTTLITGANRGIGLSLARLSAQRGEKVFAVCRRVSPELKAVDAHLLDGIDVTRAGDLVRMIDHLDGATIDRVFANAGVLHADRLGGIDDDAVAAIRQQFEVNALGPLLTVQALVPNLAPGARIAITTSRMGSIADNDSGGYYGYRMSKAAVNAAGKSLAIDLRPRGVLMLLLHPGYVQTDMTGDRGDLQPDEAAALMIQRLDELVPEDSGCFRHSNGEPLPW